MNSTKKILILGGLGFIGKNLYKGLVSDGHHVTILTEYLHESNDGFLTKEVRKECIVGNIQDATLMEQLVRNYDVIYSLAGSSGAADSLMNPFHDLDNNLKGHLTLLEACRKNNPRALLVFPSSRLVYGKPQTHLVNEMHPTHPESIYAVHKLTTENYYLLYQQLYGMPCVILRISNPYGPYQRFGSSKYGILNWFIHKAVHNETIELFGDGEQQRDFIYIDDLVELLKRLATETPNSQTIFNVGSGIGVSMVQAVDAIKKVIPTTSVVFKPWPELDKKIETGSYLSDISLVSSAFLWHPITSFEEGIKRTVQFYEGILA